MEQREQTLLSGLTDEEVAKRIAEGKVNGSQEIKTKSVGKILFTNIFTLFNGIFAVIAVILGVLLFTTKHGKYTFADFSDFGFLGVLVVNTLIGIVQELKAKKTIDRLSLLSAPKVSVLRNGEERDIPIEEIVLDDLVLLTAGRQICADSVVAEGFVEVNESLITGEPDAIPKTAGDQLLSGSYVVSGTAKARVIHVGKENYATKISAGAKYIKDCPSEIRRALLRFIRIMGIVIIPLGAALFCIKHFLHGNEVESTVKSVMGNLIGMIPSGLVTLTSAVFCVSVVRLSRNNALAQDLYCVETLARIDTLCLDKTGTLTEGSMLVETVLPKKAGVDVDGILRTIVAETKDVNVTARAITEYTKRIPPIEGKKLSVVCFSSKYKYSGYQTEEGYFLLGAPEILYRKKIAEIEGELAAYEEKGMRVLALVRAKNIADSTVCESELLALIIISDKIRKEAPETLRFFDEQGVDIKIISGDNPVTVSKIAERAGVKKYDRYVDASTLSTEEALKKAAEEYTIFGRTTPDQKLSLVKALRTSGRTVAMTGDGVNDVLALRESDCSVAVASGSDAAKNVSQLVLLDNNFASLPRAVAEGRRTINNLERSASLYLVKTIYNVLFAVIFLFISSDLPFLPRHMTFIGSLTIGIPSVVLALEPNKEIVKGKFFRKVLGNAFPAALTVVVCIVTATLASRAFGGKIDPVQLSTVCTVIAGFIGFLYVAKISYPFNVWRVTLIVCLAGAFVAAFFARFEMFDAPKFFGLTAEFNTPMAILLGTIGGGSVPLFVGLTFLEKFINKKTADKRIRLLDALDGKGEK